MSAIFIDCPPYEAQFLTPELRDIVPGLAVNTGAPPAGALAGLLAGHAGALVFNTPLPGPVLAACPGLAAVVYFSTGFASYIDAGAAQRLGIRVRGVKGYGDTTVAEHALALMLAAARDVAAMDRDMRAGRWEPREGVELEGKTLGVVGLGGTGRALARMATGIGMGVLGWSRGGVPPGVPCEAAGLDDLLERSHVVSLHLALTPETREFIDRRRLALMRPGAVLVNTARGGLIDEPALIEALETGRVRHAALDVFAEEPLPRGHPLTRLANVTVTPHAAYKTPEALTRLLRMGLETLRDELAAAPN